MPGLAAVERWLRGREGRRPEVQGYTSESLGSFTNLSGQDSSGAWVRFGWYVELPRCCGDTSRGPRSVDLVGGAKG